MDDKTHKEEQLTLELLDAIEKDSDISQRHLAKNMGIALGLANSYLKRCIKKGLIKIHDAPANRYLYYLTPKGFAEKSRLTAEYFSSSLSFYRKASDSCHRVFDECEKNNWRRLLLVGVSELAEIACLHAAERDIVIIGFYDPTTEKKQFLGKTIWSELEQADAHDVRVITDTQAPSERLAELEAQGDISLLCPDILRIGIRRN